MRARIFSATDMSKRHGLLHTALSLVFVDEHKIRIFPLLKEETRGPHLCNERVKMVTHWIATVQERNSAGIESGPVFQAVYSISDFPVEDDVNCRDSRQLSESITNAGVSGSFLVKQILQVFCPSAANSVLILDEHVFSFGTNWAYSVCLRTENSIEWVIQFACLIAVYASLYFLCFRTEDA